MTATPNFKTWRNAPYGRFYEPSGAVVLHDRRYSPIARIIGDQAQLCDRAERVEFVDQDWLYSDATAPAHSVTTRRLIGEIFTSYPVVAAEVKRRNRARN